MRVFRLFSFGTGRARWLRRTGRRVRRFSAAVSASVALAGTLAAPVAVATGGVVVVAAVSSVGSPTPAKATTGLPVAVVLVNGESSAPEIAVLNSAGYNAVPVTPAALALMSQTTFQGYAAVVIGDSSTSTSCSATAPSTASLGSQWEGWVNGNVAVLGTAPAMPGTAGSNALITDAVGYAAAQQPSPAPSVTGLYLSLNCAYATAAAGTAVSLLNGVESIGTVGGVTVNGSLACTDPGTVNKWEAAAAGTFGGFTSDSLGTGSWPSPACPVQEAFDSWPAMFTPVAYDAASDATVNFTASDGATGQPYILLGAPISAGTQSLTPGTGGEVPSGATVGGGNPAAPGVTQESAADGVDTESGDFSQSAGDFSIPTFGPSLDFTRSYDAQSARQQTVAGTPGPMGYGWTDNWATSLTTGEAVPGDIYTIAGRHTGDDGDTPTSQSVYDPGSVSESAGNTYIADTENNQILEIPGASGTQWGIVMTAGHMYRIAGSLSGAAGQTGNDTTAANTLLNVPGGVAANASGLYIADTGNCRVVELAASDGTQWGISMTGGDMYTIAGRGVNNCGDGDDNKVATQSNLNTPTSVSLGVGANAGDLYIADDGNGRIQEVPIAQGTEWGQSMTANFVYTVAGGSSFEGNVDGQAADSIDMDGPEGVKVGGGNNLFIADTGNCRVLEVPWANTTQWGQSMTAGDAYTVAGRWADCAAGIGDKLATQSDLNNPSAVWAGNGNLYIADSGNNRVQEVAGSDHTEFGQAMTTAFVYRIAGVSSTQAGYSGDGGLAGSAMLSGPDGVWVDGSGNLIVADEENNRIREVNASSDDISTIAGNGTSVFNEGDGGSALAAGLRGPFSASADAQGDVFIADWGNNRVQEIAASSHTQFGIAMTAGDTYTVAGSEDGASGTSGDGGRATAALLAGPEDVALDPAGNLYIADWDNNRVQEVPAGNGTQWGQPMTAGDIYTIAGSATGASGTSGDGGPAGSALLSGPDQVVLDGLGNLYIADTGNNRIREIAAASGPQRGQSMTAGDIYTIAGSGFPGYNGNGRAAVSAELNDPQGVVVDAAGDVYISDSLNDVVREVAGTTGAQWGLNMTANDIYTIAGQVNDPGDSGDGGPASAALLAPAGIALDAAGDVYLADPSDSVIREIAKSNGTQWHQQMTAGDIYTVVGEAGEAGNSGDGGLATGAKLEAPKYVSVDHDGNLFIADFITSTIREVTSTSGSAFATSPVGSGVAITQADGSQVAFYPKTGTPAACTDPYVDAGGDYCTLPQNVDATLTLSSGTFTYSPSPGDIFNYNASTGVLQSESDTAGDTLTVEATAPGSGNCPSTAASCQTITAASHRPLVVGSNSAGLVTSVTDPMGRAWTYEYDSASQLITATDPMGNVTSYSYGAGDSGNPQLANDMLTITGPNGQPGGPDAGDATVNVYDSSGRVTSQTDPMGNTTTFGYCVDAAVGDCMNTATGTGFITVSDPDGNSTVYDYLQGTLAARSAKTGTTLTSETDFVPDQTATAGDDSAGTQLVTAGQDGNGQRYTTSFNLQGQMVSAVMPDGGTGSDAQVGEVTQTPTSQGLPNCTSDVVASATCSQAAGPSSVSPGGVISPPSGIPPQGVTWTLYDSYGNDLWVTAGVYPPGSSVASYAQTTYQLFNGNSVTLNGHTITCTAVPAAPSPTLPCATVNDDGVVTQLAYDSQGDLASTSVPDGNGSELATTTYAYDGDGEQTSTVNPDGNVPAVPGPNAGNYTTSTVYNDDGLPTSVTQGGGPGYTDTPRTTTSAFDGDGNQISATDARGYTTETAFNADDQPTLVTDPDNQSTLTCYDGDGNTAQTVPPVGVDDNGLSAASCPGSYPAGYLTRLAADATVATYNALGQQTQQTTPAPAGQSGFETTTYSYDPDGNLTQEVDPPVDGQEQATTSTYNSAGELATQTSGTGSAASTISYCYDPTGQQTAVVDGAGNSQGVAPCETGYPFAVDANAYPRQAANQYTYSYDSSSELVSESRPGGATTTFSYDPSGNQLTSTDPNGIVTTEAFNPGGNVTSESYSGSSAPPVSYSYDADGQMMSMTDATGTSAFSYDAFGELTAGTNGAGKTVSYGYDGDGNATSISYPLGGPAWASTSNVSYGYDHASELNSVTDFNGNTISITSNADGLPTSQALGSAGATISTAYDPTDTPSSITAKNGAGSTLQSFSYTDTPAGTITNETDTPATSRSPVSYTYDSRGRVISMTPGTQATSNYGFDLSGDLTTLPTGASAATGYNNAGELTSSTLGATTTNYAYNADGERVTATQGSTTISSGTWNGAGMLTAYTSPAAAMTSATYDGNGVRTAATFGTNQTFVWDTADTTSPQLLMDSANAYIYAGATAPAEQVNLATGAITYPVTDSLGSVRGTLNAAGTITGTTDYDAWGNPDTSGGLTASTPFGYAGGYTDPTGLIYLINRYYDPATGQFISVDPDVDQTLTPYAYTGGDPVSQTDPTGLNHQPPPGGGGTPHAKGRCANKIPSCRYDWAFIRTVSVAAQAVISGTFKEVSKDIKNKDYNHAFAIWLGQVGRGGPWDMKTHLSRLSEVNPPEMGELHTFSRVTATKQIYYNVFSNVLASFLGLDVGFSKAILEAGATCSFVPAWMRRFCPGIGANTPGNKIERQMGYEWFKEGNGLDFFTPDVKKNLGRFNHLCDVRPFPAYKVTNCKW